MTEELLQLKGVAKAVRLLKEMIGREGEIIKATKTKDGWEVSIEVIEPSAYMKKIGIPKPVYDKNVYRVILDQDMELVSYERETKRPNEVAE